MNCNEASSRFDAFLTDRLNVRETDAFLKHIENCPDCRDELEVRYMVRYTSNDFDERSQYGGNENYDLRNLLADKLNERKRFVRRQRMISFAVLVFVLAALLAFVIWFFFIPSGGL